MNRFVLSSLVVFGVVQSALGDSFVFEDPSDDRWHYPFNFTPGVRPIASTFGAGGMFGFNDRDGVLVIAWDTSALIEPGADPDSYDVRCVRLRVMNIAAAEWPVDLTIDEWYTHDVNGDGEQNADGFPRGHPDDTDGESDDEDPGRPIEVFGCGFGPVYSPDTWHERSRYVGSDSKENIARDPFPFVYQDETWEMLHVEDSVKGLFNEDIDEPLFEFTPVPWAIGVPIDYQPGDQASPFFIDFEIDLALTDDAVRRYFQEQLAAGKVFLVVTSLREAVREGGQSGYPVLFTKEGIQIDPDAAAPTLELCLGGGLPGDSNGDGVIDLTDYEVMYDCLLGPDVAIEREACRTFDFDFDDDVDIEDAAAFAVVFDG